MDVCVGNIKVGHVAGSKGERNVPSVAETRDIAIDKMAKKCG